jgi:hypothetical protein
MSSMDDRRLRDGDVPGVQLRHRQSLPRGPLLVWTWLTERRRLERWLEARVDVQASADGLLIIRRREESGSEITERGETYDFEPPRRWRLRFRSDAPGWEAATDLSLELAPTSAGCDLVVFQEGFQRLALSRCLTIWEEYRRRWRAATAKLAVLLEEEPP